ncbi:hypothetical protein TNCV_1742631 [Trichonephila clavipes]|nr:hypothetical protein TNCV_1742631 [Trichonephila clavipes]
MATGSSLTQNYSRSQSEVLRDLHKTAQLTLSSVGTGQTRQRLRKEFIMGTDFPSGGLFCCMYDSFSRTGKDTPA